MLRDGPKLQSCPGACQVRGFKPFSSKARGLHPNLLTPSSRHAKAAAAAAQEPESADQANQEETAFLASVIGDSADRAPATLSERAQQHIQRLRSSRNATADPGSLPGTRNGSSIDVTSARRPPQIKEQQQAAAEGTRVPSKAELRGTVGTVSRKNAEVEANMHMQVYEQVINSRNRLSVKLSASNKQVKQLQKTNAAHTAEITAAYDCLVRLTAEVSAVNSMAQTAAAAVQYGTDKQDTSAKMSRVLDRAQLLQQVVQDHTSHIDQLRHRKIPVVWYGIAQQVRLMGDFDGWTQGFSLSTDDIHDGTFTKFHATLSLPPGQYQVKFVVDGQWRTAPDWPTVETPQGSNNLLHV